MVVRMTSLSRKMNDVPIELVSAANYEFIT